MANALSEVADGTKDIGDAFSDMAIDFGRDASARSFQGFSSKSCR